MTHTTLPVKPPPGKIDLSLSPTPVHGDELSDAAIALGGLFATFAGFSA